ncbi:hypothetical protein Poly51_48910 [Rubripirellula tenax]|uniref:Uncharacterized protein n=1 Tax=Rubripirellula tenax TaxID=2528015 RepID=A0A5C6ELJ1_9BACT|nr:hypothetical protein Poly51_48910 [Rubripirellula tenax]
MSLFPAFLMMPAVTASDAHPRVRCTAQSITLWASIQHNLIDVIFEQTIAYLCSGLMVPCVEGSLHVRFVNEPSSISEFLACSRILSLQRLQV